MKKSWEIWLHTTPPDALTTAQDLQIEYNISAIQGIFGASLTSQCIEHRNFNIANGMFL